jgi:hypothetical protein
LFSTKQRSPSPFVGLRHPHTSLFF